MKKKGISQAWLAKQLDKSFSMVNAYACNRILPNLETLQQIAVILQVDLKDLIIDKDGRSYEAVQQNDAGSDAYNDLFDAFGIYILLGRYL